MSPTTKLSSVALLGLSHKTTPIEIRERLDIPTDQVSAFVTGLKKKVGASEAAVLSTCNRVEVYFAGPKNLDEMVDKTEKFLAKSKGFKISTLRDMTYLLTEAKAVKHLFRVAGGLDSMVLGEPQILGQVKDAYQLARSADGIGPLLAGLFERALHAGKRIRTETQIGERPISVSYAAVALARKIFGDLKGKTVLLVGLGEMGRETLLHLREDGVSSVLVTTRDYRKARSLVSEFSGQAIPYEDWTSALPLADIVITSVASDKPILESEDVQRAALARRGTPLFLIDIGVPRNISPTVGKVENVYLYNLDDLQGIVDDNLRDRLAEVPKAEGIADEEAAKYLVWIQSLRVTPTLVALRKKIELIKDSELEKLKNKPNWNAEQTKAAEVLLNNVTKKILHDPTVKLKEEAGKPEGLQMAMMLRKLFGLD